MTISNILKIKGSRPDVTVEANGAGYRLRQVGSYVDLDDGMVDDVIEAIEKLSDPALGKMFRHDTQPCTGYTVMTPAKFVAEGGL